MAAVISARRLPTSAGVKVVPLVDCPRVGGSPKNCVEGHSEGMAGCVAGGMLLTGGNAKGVGAGRGGSTAGTGWGGAEPVGPGGALEPSTGGLLDAGADALPRGAGVLESFMRSRVFLSRSRATRRPRLPRRSRAPPAEPSYPVDKPRRDSDRLPPVQRSPGQISRVDEASNQGYATKRSVYVGVRAM
jgi:hypothetical protein